MNERQQIVEEPRGEEPRGEEPRDEEPRNEKPRDEETRGEKTHGGVALSPFAPPTFPPLKQIVGIEARVAALALRYRQRYDLLALSFAKGSTCAALFTRSSAPAAPIVWSRQAINANPYARALLINAGQANAMSGTKGERALKVARDKLAEIRALERNEVLIASTGVIGEPPDGDKIARALPELFRQEPCGWLDAATAITTTDSYPKGAGASCYIEGTPIEISAIAKGSGMIAPNMATMLAVVATDAKLEPETLREILRETNESSFNSITIDGDTSTNDMVLAVASGAKEHRRVASRKDAHARTFVEAFANVMQNLARQIAMDGEGIGKFITVRTRNASSRELARKIGLSILSSPLVKIALAYDDPNWGRIVMAMGKTEVEIDWQKVVIAFGENSEHVVFAKGEPIEQNERSEKELAKEMAKPRLTLNIDLRAGDAPLSEVWGCDLTHENLRINGEYRS